MVEGDYTVLRANLMPSGVTNKGVIWTSSNLEVAELDNEYSGELHAASAGTAVITARAAGNNNVIATCTVTVTEAKACPSNGKQVVLPSDLKEIKSSAFEGMDSITKVILPDGVTTIDDNAFADCRCLESIYIPDSVTYIGDDVFRNARYFRIYCDSYNYVYVYALRNNIDVRFNQ